MCWGKDRKKSGVGTSVGLTQSEHFCSEPGHEQPLKGIPSRSESCPGTPTLIDLDKDRHVVMRLLSSGNLDRYLVTYKK